MSGTSYRESQEPLESLKSMVDVNTVVGEPVRPKRVWLIPVSRFRLVSCPAEMRRQRITKIVNSHRSLSPAVREPE